MIGVFSFRGMLKALRSELYGYKFSNVKYIQFIKLR